MFSIHKLAKMFEELTVHDSRITGEQAQRINDGLMFNPGISGIESLLEKENLKLGPNVDETSRFITTIDGDFIINAFIEESFDRGSDSSVFKIRPKDMRGLIKDFEVDNDESKRQDWINSMEAYHRWDDDGLN